MTGVGPLLGEDRPHEVEALRLHNHDTGEIKSWPGRGVDEDGWEWRHSDIEVALFAVPTLVEAVRVARAQGKRLVVLCQQEDPLP